MQVVAHQLLRFGGDLARGAGAVRHRAWRREGALLTLFDETGRAGQGEATPMPGYSVESLSEVLAALTDVCAAPLRLDDLDDPVAALRLALAPHAPRLAHAPSARFAVETALLDLAGQRVGRSVASLLGSGGAHAPIAVNGNPGAALDADLVIEARRAVDRGVTALKVKVGAPSADGFRRELEALAELRRAVGEVELRLDANGAWTVAEARARGGALADLGVSLIEQPVAPRDLWRLGRLAVPWAADESMGDPAYVDALLGDDPRRATAAWPWCSSPRTSGARRRPRPRAARRRGGPGRDRHAPLRRPRRPGRVLRARALARPRAARVRPRPSPGPRRVAEGHRRAALDARGGGALGRAGLGLRRVEPDPTYLIGPS
ncbi:MAG: enolase C-terminal domain-like protein [Polyangiales bacterium]